MELRLRRISASDIDLIYGWANDSETRKNSFNSEPIPYEDHCRWFAKKLADKNVGYYILCDGDTPVGQIRYEIDGKTALTNYGISSEYRGRGLGKAIVPLGEQRVLAEFPEVSRIIAYVKKDNIASAKIFRGLGYTESFDEAELAYEKELKK